LYSQRRLRRLIDDSGNNSRKGIRMSERSTRRRPFGVTVIICIQVLSMLVAGLYLFAVFAMLAGYVEVDEATLRLDTMAWSTIQIMVGLIVIYGLWRLRRWAWFITMLNLGVSMTFDIYNFFYGEPNYWSMLFNVLMVFYLNQREVQNAFVRRRTEART
jgi:uncharacterized membrane protein (DUF2068 family)